MHDASKVVKAVMGDASLGRAPRRIAVIGRGGAGKTTVAMRLGRELGLPVVHLDRLYWGPGWQPVDAHVFGERQAAAIAGDGWVIDGGYLASAGWEARIKRADLVVVVEAPLAACLRRILRRSLSRSDKRRPDLPDGCEETLSLFFVRWTIGWRRRNKEALARIERTRPVVRVAHGRSAAINETRSKEETMLEADDQLTPHPTPPQPWLYGPRLVSATRVALEMHATQVRKGSDVPYASHLLGTCSIALDHGANEDQAIAALLHDAIEDVHYAPGAREAVAAFGPEVLRIVEACTDADTYPKPPWKARKAAYIEHLADVDGPVLLVSAADKLHNARSMVADHRRVGAALWDRFKATRAETLWNYRALVTVFRTNPAHPKELVDELDRTVTELERLAATEEGEEA